MNRSRTPRFRATIGRAILAVALSAVGATAAFAQDTILHNFTGGATDGMGPDGTLTISGSTLYGMTSGAGSSSDGTIFTMNTSGGGFNVLHSFSGSDGAFPIYDSLTLSGSTLYGMTLGDNTDNQGTLFTISTSGSGFNVLHIFTGSTSDGGRPLGSLTVGGSTLYGTTSTGGSSNDGSVFSISNTGTGFNLLHSFTGGGNSDGLGPEGSLLLVGSTLYGTTRNGGTIGNQGTIFSMDTSGGSYAVLHDFTGGASDGAQPFGSLTLIGSTLYGMTEQGGSSGKGTLFSMNANGTGFTVLHTFTGGAGDGAFPLGSLTLLGGAFYGLTENGGSADDGVAFTVNTDGTGFRILDSFVGTTSDGANPQADLTPSGDFTTLYSTAMNNGSAGDGVVFSVSSGVPEPGCAGLCALGALLLAARRRR